MQHTITITVPNSAAGIPTSRDGMMGMVLKGIAVAGKLILDSPYLLTQVSDAETFGIDAAYDSVNSLAVFQQISEFYSQAGDGAFLWIQVTATANAYAAYVGSEAFSSFIRYSASADITQQIKIIGLCYDVPAAIQSATDFPADVPAAVIALQTIQKTMFAVGYCFSGIVDGYNMSSAVTPETIGTQATGTSYAVSLCITGTKGNGVSAVGLALGKFARISIGRGMGAVEDGAINTSTAFLTNGVAVAAGGLLTVGSVYTPVAGSVVYNGATYTPGVSFTAVTGHTAFTTPDIGYVVNSSTPIAGLGDPQKGGIVGMDETDLNTLGAKQYLFITTVRGISGLFWNDGATCTAPSQFFCSQEYNRVANALAYDARAFFVLLRGLNLLSDTTTGDLDPTFCQLKQKSFYTTFISPLTGKAGSGDITDGSLTVTGPNYAVTAQLNFSLRLVRATILGNVVGTLSFVATL